MRWYETLYGLRNLISIVCSAYRLGFTIICRYTDTNSIDNSQTPLNAIADEAGIILQTDMSSEDVVFRRAVLSDYSQLASMDRTIFNGHDYLPHRYVEFMNNPNYVCFILEKDGIIVSIYYKLRSGSTKN